jgi:hypothetical protein
MEVLRAAALLPWVEAGRRLAGPKPLVRAARALGRHGRARDDAQRDRLRRAIAWLDARCPGEANCYRRVLLETALDPAAAREPFRMGLRRRGGPASGHAWLADRDGSVDPEPYEAVIEL